MAISGKMALFKWFFLLFFLPGALFTLGLALAMVVVADWSLWLKLWLLALMTTWSAAVYFLWQYLRAAADRERFSPSPEPHWEAQERQVKWGQRYFIAWVAFAAVLASLYLLQKWLGLD